MAHNRYQNRGGEDIVFETEKALLQRAGHDVVVYERHNDEIASYGAWRRADLLRRTTWASGSARAIREILSAKRPRIAYFHNTFPLISPAAYYACVSAGVPVVQTLPNYRLICPGANLVRDDRICELCVGKLIPWQGVRHSCYRGSRTQSAAVAGMLLFHRLAGTWQRCVHTYVTLTEFSRRKLIDGGLPPEKVVVKPNFVYPDPGPRQHDAGYALFVGRLSEEKGVSTLLRAWGGLPGIPLKIAGDGPLRSIVDGAAARAPEAKVQALGWLSRRNTLDLVRGASFLVTPSSCYEAFPLAIVEALACGVPVLGSRLGAVGEIVRHEESGLLFDPGDPAALADTARHLWDDEPLRSRLGEGARAQFETLYTADRNYNLLMEIFDAAVG